MDRALETARRNPWLFALVSFLWWQLPIGFLQAWSALDHKTLPEWLAANGWPRLRYLLAGWYGLFFFVMLIALIVVVRFSRKPTEIKASNSDLLERLRIAEMNAATAGQLASVAHSAATSVATRIETSNRETERQQTSDISFELTGLSDERYNEGVQYMLARFTYKTGTGYSPKVQVKVNLRIFDDDSMRMKEFSGVWRGSKLRSKGFTSDDSANLVVGLVPDEGMIAYEYNILKTVNGTELSPKLAELDGRRFYVLAVFIGRTADEMKLFEKRQWFAVIAGSEPKFVGLIKQPSHLV